MPNGSRPINFTHFPIHYSVNTSVCPAMGVQSSILTKASLNNLSTNNKQPVLYAWGTRWQSSLRHFATNRKVVGSIPDGVTGIFH